jgi:hypothetical protein
MSALSVPQPSFGATSPSNSPAPFQPLSTPISTSVSTGFTSLSISGSAPTILDKPISKGITQVSLSSFSYLFSELVQYCQQRVDAIAELEKRLHDMGYQIGLRSLELLTYRHSIQSYLLTNSQTGSSGSSSNATPNQYSVQQPISLSNVVQLNGRKEKNLIAMLQFLHSYIWKSLFGRVADGLEKATDKEDEYYIYEREPLTNRFISVPKEFSHFNCATFVAGIINGILDGAEFQCDVSAHFNTAQGGATRTVYVIKFEKEITKREA